MKNFILISLFFSIPFFLKAQVDAEVIKKYPAGVSARIYQVALKVPLEPQRQLALGEYYATQDKLANDALQKGQPIAQVAKMYEANTVGLAKILTPLELNDYLTELNPYSPYVETNPFKLPLALKYRQQIKLTQDQVNKFLEINTQLNNVGYKENSDRTKYENSQLSQILSITQYKLLLSLINQPKATVMAKEDWEGAKKHGLVSSSDSIKTFRLFYSYQLAKSIETDFAAGFNDQLKMDSVKLYFDKTKPPALIKLAAYNGIVPRSQFSDIIQHRKEIGLSNTQADSLLDNIVELEGFRALHKENNLAGVYYAKTYEDNNITRLLDVDQYKAYLIVKNLPKAIDLTRIDWASLSKFKLTDGLDRLKTMREIQAYELEFMVATDLLNMYKTQKNAFAKKDIQDKRLPILVKLDEATKGLAEKTTVNKALGW